MLLSQVYVVSRVEFPICAKLANKQRGEMRPGLLPLLLVSRERFPTFLSPRPARILEKGAAPADVGEPVL